MRVASFNAIKSMSQRALLRHWRDIGGGTSLPSLEQFAPPPDGPEGAQLMYWTIEGDGERRTFKTLQHGRYLAEAFGVNPLPLQGVQSVVPPSLQRIVLNGLNACAHERAPIYEVLSTRDEASRRINCERLLLPFGDQHGNPRQIVTTLQLISLDAAFTRRSAFARFVAEATVTFTAKIVLDRQDARSEPATSGRG